MRFLFILITLIPVLSNAQVKEINFLGKEWYLVGYDFRIKARDYGRNYYHNLANNSSFPNEHYQKVMNLTQVYLDGQGVLGILNTLSAGVVFRPFNQSKIRFIKQFEISHNIELERLNSGHISGDGDFYSKKILVKSFEIGYNPRIIINSPTFADYLKLYVSADGYAFLPISNYVYNQIDESYLLNNAKGYTLDDVHYSDRLTSPHFKIGGGVSAGIKMNVDCNWNFHIEASAFDSYTRHRNSNSILLSGNKGIQIGLRYKLGISEEDNEEEGDSPSIFW